jgi:hypothetical protein
MPTRPDTSITFHVEPSDRSVGIMAEGFSAWDNSPESTAWCDVADVAPMTFCWYSNESEDKCEPPTNHVFVEEALRGFVDAYYGRDC